MYSTEGTTRFDASNYPYLDLSGMSELDANGDGIDDYLETMVTVDGVPANSTLSTVKTVSDIATQVGVDILVASGAVTGGVGAVVGLAYTVGSEIFFGALAKKPKVHEQDTILFGTGFTSYDKDGKAPIQGADATGLPCHAGFPLYLLDFNRDGRDDVAGVCSFTGQAAALTVSASNGDGSFSPYPVPVAPAGGITSFSQGPIVFDVDGDSLQDIVSCAGADTLEVRLRLPQNLGAQSVPFDKYFSDPIQLKRGPSDPPLVLCSNQQTPAYNIVDIDGDGVQDLLVRYYDPFALSGQPQGSWYVLRYSAGGGVPLLSWQPVQLTDVGQSQYGQGMAVADFNGDGLPDIYRMSGNKITVWTNTGNHGFVSRTLDHPIAPSGYDYRTSAVLDVNSDGVDDVVESWTQNDDIHFYNYAIVPNSDVSAFSLTPLPEIQRVIGDQGNQTTATFNAAADINGDGAVDLFGPHGIFYGHPVKTRLLSSVVDGSGNYTSISYDEPGRYGDTCTGSTWPETCLKHMTGLVTSYTQGVKNADGSGNGEHAFSYTYLNGRTNVAGHGWLGFDKVTVTEAFDTLPFAPPDRTTETVFEPPARFSFSGARLADGDATPGYLYPTAGMPKTITVSQEVSSDPSAIESAGHLHKSVVENTWAVEVSTAGLPFAAMTGRTSSVYDRLFTADNDSLTTTCVEGFTPDQYGNVTRHTSECDNQFESTETKTDYAPDEGAWLISNPELITVSGSTIAGASEPQIWDPAYDSLGRLYSMTRGPGRGSEERTTTYSLDDYGLPYQVKETVTTGEAPRITTIGYDGDHVFPYTLTRYNQTNELHYDERWGLPKTTTDPNGVATLRSYDGLGLLHETVDAGGATTLYTYTKEDGTVTNAVGPTYPRLRITTTTQGAQGTRSGNTLGDIDNHGRTVHTESEGYNAEVVIADRAYDNRGRLVGSTLPYTASGGEVPLSLYQYDGLDRLTVAQHADGTFMQRQYASIATLATQHGSWVRDLLCSPYPSMLGCAQDVVEQIDESGLQSVAILDLHGQVIRAFDGDNIDPAPLYTTYFWDTLAQLRVMVENSDLTAESASAQGPTHVLQVDGYGRLLSHTDPDTGKSTNTYNGFDELATATDTQQRTRTFFHDALGRLTSVSDGDGTATWIYDQGVNALGRLSTQISPGSTANPAGQRIDYTYEAVATPNRGLLKRADYTVDGSAYSLVYDYDDLGRLDQINYPDLGSGAPIVAKYRYDDFGNLAELSQVQSGVPKSLWIVNDAFAGHLVQDETFGNGAHTAYGYDQSRQFLKTITTTQVSPSQTTDTLQSITYQRNGNGQVSNRSSTMGTAAYTYDALGRLLSADLTNPAGSQVQHLGYGYDNYGNITQNGQRAIGYYSNQPHLVASVGSNVYQYDASGNVQNRLGPDIPGGVQSISYTTSNLPARITSGAEPTTFEYTADQVRLVRRDVDRTRYFISNLYQRLAASDGSTIEERFRLFAGSRAIGEILRKPNSPDKLSFFHADDVDTVDTISSATTSDSSKQQFEPFGADLNPSAPEVTRAGFAGNDHDRDLGLIDMNGRIYDPLAGRFASPDPMMATPFWSQGLNRYSYVFNDPVNLTDPSGFCAVGFICTQLGPYSAAYPNTGSSSASAASGSSENAGSALANNAVNLGSVLNTAAFIGGTAADIAIEAVVGDPFAARPGYSINGAAQTHRAQSPVKAGAGQGGADPILAGAIAGNSNPNKYNPVYMLFGSAVHRAIEAAYRDENFGNRIFLERAVSTIGKALGRSGGSRWSYPDIFNFTTGGVYDIKAVGLESEGVQDAQSYVDQLNGLDGGRGVGARLGSAGAVGTSGTVKVWGYTVQYWSDVDGVSSYERIGFPSPEVDPLLAPMGAAPWLLRLLETAPLVVP